MSFFDRYEVERLSIPTARDTSVTWRPPAVALSTPAPGEVVTSDVLPIHYASGVYFLRLTTPLGTYGTRLVMLR
jgi:hypothetical protein